jgi:hypothetical protein
MVVVCDCYEECGHDTERKIKNEKKNLCEIEMGVKKKKERVFCFVMFVVV